MHIQPNFLFGIRIDFTECSLFLEILEEVQKVTRADIKQEEVQPGSK